jgi:plastocyanin
MKLSQVCSWRSEGSATVQQATRVSKRIARRLLWITPLAAGSLVAAACGGGDFKPSAEPAVDQGEGSTDSTPAPTGCGADGEIELKVSGDFTTSGPKFDPVCLVAPADEPFKISFENVDAGVEHNIAVFVESGGKKLGATKLEKGPTTQSLSLGPLAPGDYVFLCTVHERVMRGTLAVVDAH